jgi:predicted HicB family RNase H-like nuclease
MTFDAVYTQLKAWGSESYRKILEEQEVRTENLRRVSGKLTLQQRSDNSPER